MVGLMEISETTSEHLFRVYAFVRDEDGWVTAHDIAAGAKVAERTARAHALRLVKAGVFDQVRAFPGHRYRLAAEKDKSSQDLVQRLEGMADVFSV